MPIVRSVAASHIPVVRTTLIVLAALLASVASAAVDLVDSLDVDEGIGPSPSPSPSPPPGPDAPPPPLALATEGVPESILEQAIAATQAQLLLGDPGAPGAGLFIDNIGDFRGALINACRTYGIKVIGYPLPTVPDAQPPSLALAQLILAQAYTVYSTDTQGGFTTTQAQAFYDTLTAGAGGGVV